MADCICPACGQRVEEPPAAYVESRGMVVANGRFALLTGLEGEVFGHLIRVYPNVAMKEKLHDQIYALDPDGGANMRVLDVIICKLRKKLRPLGVEIDTAHGRGYALSTRLNLAKAA